MHWIRKRLAQFSARTAFHEEGASLTYAGFIQRIESLEETLATGLAKTGPEVVAVQEARASDSLAALLALASLGKTALPLDPDSPEAGQQKQIASARWTLRDGKLLPETAPRQPHPLLDQLAVSGHPGLILFSSGTTGQPKGMLHDLKHLLDRYKKVQPRSDTTLQLLPVDHIGGLDAALRTLCAGSALVIPDARTPDAAGQSIAAHQVNVLPASPTFLNLMLIAGVPRKHDTSSLEVIAYGAEPMPPSLLEKLSAAFPGADLQQKFGTSETGAVRVKSGENGSLAFSFSDSDTEWKTVDGELWLRSSSRILGYLNPEADSTSLLDDGWFRTGDMVEVTDGGLLRIIGRRQDLINVGGEKVTPLEVESVIMEMPEIADCQVQGEENAITGQSVAALVVPHGDIDPRELKRAIKQYCRKRLSTYKVPARIQISDQAEYSERLKKTRHRQEPGPDA